MPRHVAALFLLPVLCLVATVRGHTTGFTGAVSTPLFQPGAIMNDTDGNTIRAHQPHVYLGTGVRTSFPQN